MRILLLFFSFVLFSTAISAQKGGNKQTVKYNPDLTREDKNTMSTCPLHKKHMPLSDNYRANASDSRQSEDYPFAYQLNYRRYCPTCTKTLTQEEKSYRNEESANANKPVFERCTTHNETMFTNGQYSSVNSEKNVDPDTPHAQQYQHRIYCKTCTKIYKVRDKAAKKAGDKHIDD